MRILFESWRKYVKHSLHEGAISPQEASSRGLTFEVEKTKFGHGGWKVEVTHDGEQIAYIKFYLGLRNKKAPCLGAYEVDNVWRREDFDGLGPLLHDIAMEIAGEKGIMPDRRNLSDAARGVWGYYLNSRPDVEATRLTPVNPFGGPAQSDCIPLDGHDVSLPDWENSPLAMVYRRKDRSTPVIDQLNKLGIINFISDINEYDDWQKEANIIKTHPMRKARILDTGANRNTGGGKGHKRLVRKRGKSAPPGAGAI